ncbi:MAG: YbaK/prolyl-tRNA synthetase associated region [Naasia sp.]|nr:YbaK/prolyl-tRNA synthetase associated region [Naasia sp.]
MRFGTLDFLPAADHRGLLAAPVRAALDGTPGPVLAAPIDPELADTAAFCERYGIGMADSANCVVVEGRRGDELRYAACLILATDRIDVNGVVRRLLEAKKASFAPMAAATSLSGMEYGGITPIGLPPGWPVFVDEAVAASGRVVIGSGLRASKLLVRGALLAALPGARVLPIVKPPAPGG